MYTGVIVPTVLLEATSAQSILRPRRSWQCFASILWLKGSGPHHWTHEIQAGRAQMLMVAGPPTA